MKLLITDIHHGNGGGHVTYVLNLIRGLRGDHDITVAAPPSGRLMQRVREMDGVRAVPTLYTSRPFVLVREVAALRRFLTKERFDVVHVNGSADHRHVMLATLGMESRPRIVWTKHNTNRLTSVGHRLRAKLGTDAAIGVSEYVGGMLKDSPYVYRPIHVVRNGVDLEHWRSVSATEKQNLRNALFGPLPTGTLVLGSSGGTDRNKGWHLLVEAAARLPAQLRERLRLVVAGDPPSAELRETVERSGMSAQVCFPGLVSDVKSVLGACDAGFVVSFKEAASYACYEAMAMGLPTLVSDAEALPENIRDGIEGWIVPTGNVDALVPVLQQMLENPEALPQMGMKARSRVESMFCVTQFVHQTQNVYRHVLSMSKGVPALI